METFYNNIKSVTTNVYKIPEVLFTVNLQTNASWALYRIDNGSWESYENQSILTLNRGTHIFEFRSTAGWAAPQDFSYDIQENKIFYIVYMKSYNILMDALYNFQYGDIFIA